MPITAGKVNKLEYEVDVINQDTRMFVDNFEYTLWKDPDMDAISLSRINNSEGYTTCGLNPKVSYYYYRKDHLGNNREVWRANDKKTLQRTQYYPSGLPWAECENAEAQPYKYNGKEFIEMHGYDTYDYGWRGLQAAIMRFNTIDPLVEKYYSISPYAYCANNPVKYVDPDGRGGMVTGTGAKNDPYFVTANYYYQKGSLNKDQVEGLNSAVDAYNKSGGKNGVEVKNADGSTSYVKYNLSAQGVDDVDVARKATAFETSSGETRYYGNTVGTQPNGDGAGGEFGSANNIRVNFNVANINAGVESGMNSSSLNKGVAIHEIGHNLGGEHSDGTSVMDIIQGTTSTSQIGGATTTSYSYPSMSNKFTKVSFNRRDSSKRNMGDGRLWTRKP